MNTLSARSWCRVSLWVAENGLKDSLTIKIQQENKNLVT
jgi:hypothetical protein